MDNKKLNLIRGKIDKIDHILLDVIKKRTNLVKEVIKIKKLKKQIVDKSRIKKVLQNIKKISKCHINIWYDFTLMNVSKNFGYG